MIDLDQPGVRYGSYDELGNAIAASHLVALHRIGVHQHDCELSAETRINESGRVQACHAMRQRQAATRLDKSRVAWRNGYRYPRWHHGASTTRLQTDRHPRVQVHPGIALTRIARHRKLWVEPEKLYLEHFATLAEPSLPTGET